MRKLKLITQAEPAECGLTSLLMIGNYHGHDMDLRTVRPRYPQIGLRGATFRGLINAASDLQFDAQPVKIEIDGMKELTIPAILHWDMNHFVVFAGMAGNKFRIYDPAGVIKDYSVLEFSAHFTGVALELSPKRDFEPETARSVLKLSMIAKRTKGLGRSLIVLFLVSMAIMLLSLTMPYYSMVTMDEIVPGKDLNLLNVVFTAAIGVVILQSLMGFFRDRLVLYLNKQFTLQSSHSLMNHLLHLPMSFFERRQPADVLSRLGSMDEVQEMMTSSLVTTVIDCIIMLATLVLLTLYAWQLTAFVLSCTIVYFILRSLFQKPLKRLAYDAQIASSMEISSLMESVKSIQSIKLFGIEESRISSWDRSYSKKLNLELKSEQFTATHKFLNHTLFRFQDLFVLFWGAHLVISGSLSLGILMAFLAQKDQFIQKFSSTVDMVLRLRMLDVPLERLADILQTDAEIDNANTNKIQIRGSFEMRGISFRFSKDDPMLFNDLSIHINPGESVAIIGPSGSGKTTLLKIMLGLLEPYAGDIAVDGMSVRNMQKAFRRKIATVMQNDSLIAGTVAENIAFFDDYQDVERIESSAMSARIHDDIKKMPEGYQTHVSDFTNTLSGGQRQRLLIARALYKSPKILFLDEATSALDPTNESLINETIKNMGITRIIIAHRPDTIRSADRIYALEEGKLLLVENYDHYRELKEAG